MYIHLCGQAHTGELLTLVALFGTSWIYNICDETNMDDKIVI